MHGQISLIRGWGIKDIREKLAIKGIRNRKNDVVVAIIKPLMKLKPEDDISKKYFNPFDSARTTLIESKNAYSWIKDEFKPGKLCE